MPSHRALLNSPLMRRRSLKSFGYPVDWDETEWEEMLWPQARTWQLLLDLIDKVAAQHGRSALVNAPDGSTEHELVTLIDNGKQRFIEAQFINDRRGVAICSTIHRAIRMYHMMKNRLNITKKLAGGPGSGPRKIVISQQRANKGSARELTRLHDAVEDGSQYQFEVAFLGLSDSAHDFLGAGFKAAKAEKILADYKGALEVKSSLLSRPILAPALLKVILPFALRLASAGGRPRVGHRDAALAAVLEAFVELSGDEAINLKRFGIDEPIGEGADFVRQIEALFDVELMPHGSHHAVGRALGRKPQGQT